METLEPPCIVPLRNGKHATLALAEASDGGDLLELYRAMPEEDRLVLTDDVTTADWLDRFLAKLRSGEAISVIGRIGGEIRGEARQQSRDHETLGPRRKRAEGQPKKRDEFGKRRRRRFHVGMSFL